MLPDPVVDNSACFARGESGTLPVVAPQRSAWGRLWRRPDFRMLCLAAFAAIIASKGGALLPGMAPDDYFFAFSGAPRSITSSFIAQGRALDIPLAMFVDSFGATFTSVAWFAFWMASATISVAIATSIVAIKRDERNHFYHYLCAVFIATHPYLTSYFLFKMSILNTAIVYGLLTWLLVMIIHGTKFRHDVAAALLLAAACYISQIILVLFVVAAGAWAVWRACAISEQVRDWRATCRPVSRVAVVTIAATVVYLASSAVVRHAAHVEAVATYTPSLVGGLYGVISKDIELAYHMLLLGEPVDPRWLKAWVLAVLVLAVGACALRKPRRGFACALALLVGLLATAAPMAASWGRLVPRTFSPGGLCLGLVLCMAFEGMGRPAMRKIAVALWIPLLAFCLIGSTLFYQQLLLTRWDQEMAGAIYQRARLEAGNHPSLRIVTAWPIHRQPLSLTGPDDLNESAFHFPWAYRGLFSVATGEIVPITVGDSSLCKGMPHWPNPASTRRLDSASVLVCVGHITQ